MSLTTEIKKRKRGLSLEKRCWFSPNQNTIRLLDRTWIQVWFIYGKLRHRPKPFMKSPRFKRTIFKFKLQQQQRSENLSCSLDTIQCSAHISSSRSPNASILVLLVSGDNFPELSSGLFAQILMLVMTFSADNKIRIVTKSRGGHPLNNQSSNQQF